MSRLLLVRHGITEFNSTRRFAGYSDTELSTTGLRQVERLRDRLADEKLDAVYTSDLKRALVTAEVIAAGRELAVTTCPELREMNYGNAEGLTFAEISQRYPEVAERCVNFSLELEFPGGESLMGFMNRTLGFLDRLNDHTPSHTLLIVSHSGPLRVLACHLLGVDPGCWWQLRFDNASLSIIETYPRGAIINLLNETAYLKGLGE